MALREEKQKALDMRMKGLSYSQIKNELGVSKSTLSLWLRNHPLPSEKIRELRDKSFKRIENYRATMEKKRQVKFNSAFLSVSQDIGNVTERNLFVAGFLLYWGEGGKTGSSVGVSNTDPRLLRFFIRWIKLLGVPFKKFRVTLHLYEDMSIEEEIKFWSKELQIPVPSFTKPYIKSSRSEQITYVRGFGHGTCNV